ncbi:MAG: hypothetical protein Q9170_000920 [Blastenia crenularia]
MTDSERPGKGLLDASSFAAFFAKTNISPTPSAHQKPEEVTDKVGELAITEDKANDAKANSTVVSAVPSPVASNMASPGSKASDTIPPEKVTKWMHDNAPADHFVSKNPLLESVQAQKSPYGSPQATGVLAPPSTPEVDFNLAIGKMIADEIDNIPEERLMKLGDSRFAPKNYSRLSATARSASSTHSQDQFLSAVPRSTKPRDDPGFTRMSFQAADSPTIPAFVDPRPRAVTAAVQTFFIQGPPSAAEMKENVRRGKPKDSWSQTTATNGAKVFTPDTPNTPPAAPQLKPTNLANIKVPKVFTPATPDDQLDVKQNDQVSNGPRLAQSNPFSAGKIPHPSKKEEKASSTSQAAAATSKPILDVKTHDLGRDTTGDSSGGPLTPSSMTFTAVSPTKVRAAGITTAAAEPAKIVGDNLEGSLYFKAWPKAEERGSRSAAKHRKVLLTGLPRDCSPTFASSLVYGGPLESITVGTSTGFATFLRAEDAEKYYEATGNGLLYKKGATEHVIMTELGKDVNPVSGVLREYTEKEFTRCVRAIGVDKEWSMAALYETAGKKGRKVEKIIDGLNVSDMRSVTFRFCDIADAVKFKQTLNRHEDWEECNVHYAPDP